MLKKYLLFLIAIVIGGGILAFVLIKNDNNSSRSLPKNEITRQEGEAVTLENGKVMLDAAVFDDNRARFFDVKMPNDKTIYFFVVKDKDGVYRAAANACQVCFAKRKGFRQEGDEIVCNNCGNRYPIGKIATEKGGCNPGPINPNLEVKDGRIAVYQSDLEKVSEFF